MVLRRDFTNKFVLVKESLPLPVVVFFGIPIILSMAILTDNWYLDMLSIFATFVAIFIAWVKWCHSYWQRKGLITPPITFLFGNAKRVFTQKESFGEFTCELYNYFRSQNQPHGGYYILLMSSYMPTDPEIIKSIMQNDFNHFIDRGVYSDEENDPLSAHLFSLEGSKWRNLRVRLTPTFTSGKMKMMFETLKKCGDDLATEMDRIVSKNAVDIKDILARFTTDIIGTCAFGINCNSLKNPDNEFTKYLRLFFVDGFWENIVGFLSFVAPRLAKIFKIRVVNPKLSTFFMKVIKDTVEYREINNVHRKDFMHLLLQLKNRGQLSDDGGIFREKGENKENEVSLTFNELAAQAFVFFLAGFETSSTTMTFCLFELAMNTEIQDRLREEINEVLKRHNNELSYDAIMEMHYMDKVINETLRKYPPLPGLFRVCTKDYHIPGTDIMLETGTKVLIPVLGLQRDPEFYPDPEKFDPERFSEENKRQRHPYTFIPFGEGPRICIGLRFGMMQTKVGLGVLLKNYRFSLSNKTTLPLEMDQTSFIMSPKGGMWLDCTKI